MNYKKLLDIVESEINGQYKQMMELIRTYGINKFILDLYELIQSDGLVTLQKFADIVQIIARMKEKGL